jgi:hypothetical protein
MKVFARATCLSCFASMLCCAGDWSGWLVSAKCFASMDSNRNEIETSWDANAVVRYCTPDKDTKSFVVMRNDDAPFTFDSAGNEKAAELPLSPGKHFVYFVKVSTEHLGHAVKVQRISVVARIPRDGRGAPGLGGNAHAAN